MAGMAGMAGTALLRQLAMLLMGPGECHGQRLVRSPKIPQKTAKEVKYDNFYRKYH